eukprot:TRINITY_DN1261_c0_g1_i1.p1 TRINITY_DN1261_c0_g1~~TRINITY_DN1261_c0_g1_i1.p1  ORF type:complete len:247 (-),score=84.98 TRINITY_DN1261_c0_g1_i1:285-1025(-)
MKSISSFERLINSLKWKREGIIDKLRFESPYEYPWNDDEKGLHLMIYQSKSIAKTVWDSSIVLSKYFQKEFNQGKAIGLKALEIGCGCGLPGIVLALLGSNVVLTDLEETLEITRRNITVNALDENAKALEYKWGENSDHLGGPFDIIFATDTMYIIEEATALWNSIKSLSHPNTIIYFAYGRNRGAEDEFRSIVSEDFIVEELQDEQLDYIYQCEDVTVIKLTKKASEGKRKGRFEDSSKEKKKR